MSISGHEAHLAFQCKALGLPAPELEHHFAKPRRWRFDLAWPDRKLAAEVDGGIWTNGRHTRGKGYEADCEKICAAGVRGWVVLRFPVSWVKSGRAVGILSEALKG